MHPSTRCGCTRKQMSLQGVPWKGLRREQQWHALQSQTDQEAFESGLARRTPTVPAVQLTQRPSLDDAQASASARSDVLPALEPASELQPLVRHSQEDSASGGLRGSNTAQTGRPAQPRPPEHKPSMIMGQAPAAASNAGRITWAEPVSQRPFGRAHTDQHSQPRAIQRPPHDMDVTEAQQQPAGVKHADMQASSGSAAPEAERATSGVLEAGMGHDRLAVRVRPPEDAAGAHSRVGDVAASPAGSGDESPIVRCCSTKSVLPNPCTSHTVSHSSQKL